MIDKIYLKEWRCFAGLSQAELGRLTGISGPQVSRIETGRRDFDGKYLKAFRAAINAALDGHPLHARATRMRITRQADPLRIPPDPDQWLDLDPGLQKLWSDYIHAVATVVREEVT